MSWDADSPVGTLLINPALGATVCEVLVVVKFFWLTSRLYGVVVGSAVTSFVELGCSVGVACKVILVSSPFEPAPVGGLDPPFGVSC